MAETTSAATVVTQPVPATSKQLKAAFPESSAEWREAQVEAGATLEAAYFRLPFVLVYKVSWPTYLAGRLVVKVDYLGMPNVLANEEVVPEFIQHEAKPGAITQASLRLIDEPAARAKMISAFDGIIASLGQDGASMRAATAIAEEIA